MAYSREDVQLPYTGEPTPGRRPGDFDILDYDESPLTPPDTVSTARADIYHRVVAFPSSIQLARQRLRRSFEETEAVNRVDSVMASRSRFQAQIGGSESVIARMPNYYYLQMILTCSCMTHIYQLSVRANKALSDINNWFKPSVNVKKCNFVLVPILDQLQLI